MTRDSLVLRQDNWTGTVINRLRAFESELVVAMRLKGWDGSEDLNSLQWTFHGALFYSIIVITTIGYGHIAPKTDLGKVTTIFYAIMGIPLMLLCLSNIGDIMANSFRFLYWRICCYACTQPPKRSHPSHRRGRSFRSTVRTHGSGRTSGRSRTSSLRKHGPHGSQRSADSALALSEMTHSYSDTECRYYDEGDEGMPRGPSKKRGPGPHHHSVHGSGRYSEPRGETLQIPTKGATQPADSHFPARPRHQQQPLLPTVTLLHVHYISSNRCYQQSLYFTSTTSAATVATNSHFTSRPLHQQQPLLPTVTLLHVHYISSNRCYQQSLYFTSTTSAATVATNSHFTSRPLHQQQPLLPTVTYLRPLHQQQPLLPTVTLLHVHISSNRCYQQSLYCVHYITNPTHPPSSAATVATNSHFTASTTSAATVATNSHFTSRPLHQQQPLLPTVTLLHVHYISSNRCYQQSLYFTSTTSAATVATNSHFTSRPLHQQQPSLPTVTLLHVHYISSNRCYQQSLYFTSTASAVTVHLESDAVTDLNSRSWSHVRLKIYKRKPATKELKINSLHHFDI
ncbi:hypothetical protein J6590_040824 [Homalodisca vitripennis]|nr:hypothetical protein J6590_040824 [Homalodisca vitripennis]